MKALAVTLHPVGRVGGRITRRGNHVREEGECGATEAQIEHDRDECFARSIDTERSDRAAVGLRISREAYKACMEGRGYRIRVAMTSEVPAAER